MRSRRSRFALVAALAAWLWYRRRTRATRPIVRLVGTTIAADLIDDAWNFFTGLGGKVEDAIRDAIKFVTRSVYTYFGDLFHAVWSTITWLTDQALSVTQRIWDIAGALYNQLVALVHSVADAATALTRFLVGLVDAAWRAGVDAVTSLVHFLIGLVDAAWRAGVDAVTSLVHFLIGLVDAAWRAGVSAVESLVHFLIGLVDVAWRAGVSAVESLVHFLVGLVDAAWRAGVDAVTSLARALFDTATAVAHALVDAIYRDIIKPLEGALGQLEHEVFGEISAVLRVVKDVLDWLVWLVEFPFVEVNDLWNQAFGFNAHDVLRMIRQARADHGAQLQSEVRDLFGQRPA